MGRPTGCKFQKPNARPVSAQTVVFLVFPHGLWLLKRESSWNPAGSPHLHSYLAQATILPCLVHLDSSLAGSSASALVPKALSRRDGVSCLGRAWG